MWTGLHYRIMAIFKRDCTRIEKEKGTLGGDTYFVRHPKWRNEERAICFRPVKNIPVEDNEGRHRLGGYCERPAGWRTDHEGEGACSTHSGNAGRPSINGNRSEKAAQSMRRRIEDYLGDDQNVLMDLTFELGALRVMFQDVVDMFPTPGDDDYTIYVSRALNMITAAGSLVDKISKIENRNTITVNQVLYIRALMANMFLKYIPDPDLRERAIEELAASIPNTVSTEVVDRPRILVE